MTQVYVRANLIIKNTKALMYCGTYMFCINIFLNYILMKPFKEAGIALSTALMSLFALLYLSSSFFGKMKTE